MLNDIIINICHLAATAWMLFFVYVAYYIMFVHPYFRLRDARFPFWAITAFAVIVWGTTFQTFWTHWL